MMYLSYAFTALGGLCIGIIIMAIIADRANKAETENLRQQIDNDSRNYLRCVSQMQTEIDTLNGTLSMERHAVAALKIENRKLRGRLEGNTDNGEKTTRNNDMNHV